MPPTTAPTGAPKPAFNRILKLGSRGPDVEAVKLALRAWKPNAITNTTDFFGHGMYQAVLRFQREERIPADGVYGPSTHRLLAPYFNAAAAKLYASAKPTTKLVQPIPRAFAKGIVNGVPGGIHETAGLPGYPALDFLADAGAPVVAPEQGTIERFSGHDPASGPVSGIHGPFGWSIYLKGASGTDFYMTHLGSRFCSVGQTVHCGQKIATVGDYAKWGGVNHTHVGVNGGSVTIAELGKAPLA